MPTESPITPFRLRVPKDASLSRKLLSAVGAPIVSKALALDEFQRIYDVVQDAETPEQFLDLTLKAMRVTYQVSDEDLSHIPTEGPAVVVANHPYGAIEGVILAHLLKSIRPDVKIMANYLLGRLEQLRDVMIFVDPFGGPDAQRANLAAMRRSIEWLKGERGLLAVFPAGTVSHYQMRHNRVTDPDWNTAVARIIKRAEAPAVPIFFPGRNRTIFQLAGMLHPRLRTLLLPQEFVRRQNSQIDMRIGKPIPFNSLKEFDKPEDMTLYLRMRTYMLSADKPTDAARKAKQRWASQATGAAAGASADSPASSPARASTATETTTSKFASRTDRRTGRPDHVPVAPPTPGLRIPLFGGTRTHGKVEPVIDPVDPDTLTAEIDALPDDAMLLSSGDYDVYYTAADASPNIMREIGRLREVTFRGVGEGTGRSIDIDRFDADYLHLFVWDRQPRRIVGAYRLGGTDVILPKSGISGLYTATLFNYKRRLLDKLHPVLELGRSFVRPEYQRSYSGLMLLWKGLGHYVVRNPRYRYLLGPVSISDEYTDLSQWMIMRFLQAHRPCDLAELVRPKNPPHLRNPGHWDPDASQRILDDIDDISTLVSEIETDQRGVPILLKQYLKLGARLLGFNVDPEFGNTLDALIVIDLCAADQRILRHYFGREGIKSFRKFHGFDCNQ